MCIYVCVWGYLDKYISVATWPPQTKIPGSAPACNHQAEAHLFITLRIHTMHQPHIFEKSCPIR